MIDWLLLNDQRGVFHLYSRRERVQQYIKTTKMSSLWFKVIEVTSYLPTVDALGRSVCLSTWNHVRTNFSLIKYSKSTITSSK